MRKSIESAIDKLEKELNAGNEPEREGIITMVCNEPPAVPHTVKTLPGGKKVYCYEYKRLKIPRGLK